MISIVVLVPVLVILTIGTRALQLRDQRRAKPVERQGDIQEPEMGDGKDEDENA
jgi:hypothetical protein